MHRIHAHATLRLLMTRSDSPSSPAKIPEGVVRSLTLLTIIALMLTVAGPARKSTCGAGSCRSVDEHSGRRPLCGLCARSWGALWYARRPESASYWL